MPIIKRKDWAGWMDGMRSKLFKGGAEAFLTQITAFGGSNGLAGMGIDWLKDVGLDWKQALALFFVQLVVRLGIAGATYIKDNPDPGVITETIETSHITKDSSGNVTETGESKSVTTTPVETKP